MVKDGSALRWDSESQYRSADRSECLPPTGATVTGEPISWFVYLLERDV